MVAKIRRVNRRGAATLETSLALVPCLYFVFAILEYNRYEMARQLTINAARVGARMAINSKRTATEADVKALVTQQLAGQGGDGLTISLFKADASGNYAGAWSSAGVGDSVAVQIRSTHAVVAPVFGILPRIMPLNAKAIMRCEAN